MDWQFKVGLGVAIVFGLLPFAIKAMPISVTWGGICIGLLLALWGLIPNHDKMPLWPTLVLITGFGILISGGIWYKTYGPTYAPELDEPPIGSLRYVLATMKIALSASPEQAGVIEVDIQNATDKLIQFRATTAGNINGIAFAKEKVTFDGYMYPHESAKLVSNRVVGLHIEPGYDINKPAVVGIFEYSLRYKYAEAKEFARLTEKGIRLVQWAGFEPKAPGTEIQNPITVTFYNEVER